MVTYISERFTYKMGGGEKRLALSPYVQDGPKKSGLFLTVDNF